jgi:hypothetical protein
LLIDNDILQIKQYKISDYIPLVQSLHFKRIKKAMDELRPETLKSNFKDVSKSNFNDALALTYFLKLKKDGTIPILIDSKGFYSKIINMANLNEEFKYTLATKNYKKTQVPLIRDTAYFVIKSIFDCPEKKLMGIKTKFPDYYKILESADSEVTSIENILAENDLGKLFLTDYNLGNLYTNNKEDFGEYLEKEFFNKIWLSCYQQDSFNTFIESHFDYQKIDNINHNTTISEYKKAFKQTYESVKTESDLFSLLAQIWLDLKRTNAEEYVLIGSENNAYQAMMLFGAFRFSLPFKEGISMEKIEGEISNILFRNGFLGNTIEKNHAINETIVKIYEGICGDVHSMSIGLTILWSLERFKWINKLFSDSHNKMEYEHYSFSIFHSASMLKENTMQFNRNKVERNLLCIEKKISSQNYKYLIGKSYLYYLMWDADFKKNFSISLCTPQNNSQYYLQSLKSVTKAINYLLTTSLVYNQDQQMMLVYGLNLKIYLVVEGGSDKELNDIEREVNLFSDFETANKELWQGRYHDTIARYDLRYALINFKTNNTKYFLIYLSQAEDRVRRALSNTFQEKQKAKNLEKIILQIRSKYENNTLEDFLNQNL